MQTEAQIVTSRDIFLIIGSRNNVALDFSASRFRIFEPSDYCRLSHDTIKDRSPVALLAPAPSSARMAGYSAYTSKVRTAFIVYLTYLYACEFNVVL